MPNKGDAFVVIKNSVRGGLAFFSCSTSVPGATMRNRGVIVVPKGEFLIFLSQKTNEMKTTEFYFFWLKENKILGNSNSAESFQRYLKTYLFKV